MLTLTDIREKIISGGIDPKTLNDTLKDLRLYAYSYLYNLQKDMVNICKIHTNYESFTTRKDNVFTNNDLRTYKEFNVKIPFIHHNRRLKFRRSDLYNVPITNYDVEANRDLFVYDYFVFVDGVWDKSAKIRCREELTSICLRQENMNPELQPHFVPGCQIDIIFIPDVRSESLSATKLDLAAAGFKFSTSKILKGDSQVLTFVSKGNELPRLYEGSIEDGDVVIPEVAFDPYGDADTIDIDVMILPNHLETIDCPVGTDFFANKEVPMPVPESNVLMFKENKDSSLSLLSNVIPKKRYPNVFELEAGHLDHYRAMVYYWNNTANRNSHYDPETYPYANFIDILAAYSNGTVNPKIASYVPYLYTYDVPNFHKLGYLDHSDDPMIYKANKLFETYKLWAYASQLYHEKLHEDTNSYIIYTDNVDMKAKLRNGTQDDLVDKNDWMTFDEPMYVFIFTNPSISNHLPYKFWINGLRYVSHHIFLDGKYEYVYIPVSKIPEGSVIEIERSTNFQMDLHMETAANVVQKVDLSKLGKLRIPFNALYVTDEEGVYVDKTKVHFTTEINSETYAIPDDSTMFLSKDSEIYIHTDEAMKLRIWIAGAPIEITHKMDLHNYGVHNLNTARWLRNLPNRANCIRIFQDGRLLANGVKKITFPEDSNEPINVWFNYPGYGVIGDFQIDYIPEGYTLVYAADNINTKGVVDLSGKINKPFSMKYYDVYLNGYRLLPTQINRLANFIIQIKDVETVKILEIYEKNYGADDAYILDQDDAKNFLADALYENDEEFREKLKDWIEDIIPNTSIRDTDRLQEILEFVVNSVTTYMEIKPFFADLTLDEEFVKEYYPFFQNDVFFIDANKKYPNGYDDDESKVYFLSPQEFTDIQGINIPEYVDQFAALLVAFGNKFLDANAEREDISGFPAIHNANGTDAAILISGNNRVDRDGIDSKLI